MNSGALLNVFFGQKGICISRLTTLLLRFVRADAIVDIFSAMDLSFFCQ